jgi:hypothetical protein
MRFMRPVVRMGSREPKIKLPISYIIDCSSEIHHMTLDTCRDENAYIIPIRFFSWKKASKCNCIFIPYHIAMYTDVPISWRSTRVTGYSEAGHVDSNTVPVVLVIGRLPIRNVLLLRTFPSVYKWTLTSFPCSNDANFSCWLGDKWRHDQYLASGYTGLKQREPSCWGSSFCF